MKSGDVYVDRMSSDSGGCVTVGSAAAVLDLYKSEYHAKDEIKE